MLIDSNILIYALNSASPKAKEAQVFLETCKQLIFAQQNIFETVRILTHLKFPAPFTSDEAIEAITKITNEATIIAPTFETSDIAFELVKKYQITGTEVFDVYLVATAISNGIYTVATDNTKHLRKYLEIQVHNPFE